MEEILFHNLLNACQKVSTFHEKNSKSRERQKKKKKKNGETYIFYDFCGLPNGK